MTKGALRWTEEQYEADAKRRGRWQRGCEIVNTETVAHVVEPPAPSKYRNQKTDGYASKKEARRAAELKHLAQTGAVSDLREQVAYLIVPKAIGPDGRVIERAAHYVADFVYRDATGREVVEDTKGMRTDVYKLKRKLMLMVHGIRIVET